MPATLEKPTSQRFITSPVGRKALSGITGILLILYLAQHLLANLRIFSADPQAVSKYAVSLQAFGPLLTAIELGLLTCILAHAVVGISIWWKSRQARGVGYSKYKSAGTPSRQSLASRTMIFSGLLMLVFLGLHVAWFRFGPGVAEGYATQIGGESVRHFERLLRERFDHIGYVLFYCVVMVTVGFHLNHGFWSAFQSLGWVNPKNQSWFVWAGIVISVLLTVGFIVIPVRLYFGV